MKRVTPLLQPLSFPTLYPFIHRSFPNDKNAMSEREREGYLSTKWYGTVSPRRYQENVSEEKE